MALNVKALETFVYTPVKKPSSTEIVDAQCGRGKLEYKNSKNQQCDTLLKKLQKKYSKAVDRLNVI